MAQRRMFALTIIDSDAFLDMPQSTQLLYFHLGMRADDDGFINNAKTIMRVAGCKEDDLKLLIAKKFILPFESGVVVIKHWNINNYIQKDRYHETKYLEEKQQLNVDDKDGYTFGDGIPAIEYKTKKDSKLKEEAIYTKARVKRIEAKKESDLPSSFDYKIRNAFDGETCPICNQTMNCNSDLHMPTIQHNTPISLGGKHEIDNISVICRSCNTSIQNREITGKLNNDLVKEKWEELNHDERCIGNVYSGKDRLGKSKVRDSIELVKDSKEYKEEREKENKINVHTHEDYSFSNQNELNEVLNRVLALDFKELTENDKPALFKLKWNIQAFTLQEELTNVVSAKYEEFKERLKGK